MCCRLSTILAAACALALLVLVSPATIAQQLDNPSPADSAAGVARQPTLSWTWSGGSAIFDVYFAPVRTPTLPRVATNLATPQWTPATKLNYGTIYRWYVVAHTLDGDVTGPDWTFTTHTPIAGLTIDSNATQVSGKHFTFILTARDAFGDVVLDYQGSVALKAVWSNPYAPPVLAPGTFTLVNGRCSVDAVFTGPIGRIRLVNTQNIAMYNPNLTVVNPPDLPLPTYLSPDYHAFGVTVTPVLRWAWDGNLPATYDVYYGTNNNMPPRLAANLTTPALALAKQEYNMVYFWCIVVHTSEGDIWGSMTWFRTHGSFTRYQLNALDSPQVVGVPFPVTVTAMDSGGYVVTDRTAQITLQLLRDTQPIAAFADGETVNIVNGLGSTQLALHVPPGQVSITPTSGYGYRTINLINPPDAPVPAPVHPVDGGSLNATRPVLRWAWDSAAPATYTVYWQAYPRFSQPYTGNTTATSLPIAALTLGKTYYWWVRAQSAGGEVWGGPWMFQPHSGPGILTMTAVAPVQRVGLPFQVQVRALDGNMQLVPDWDDTLRIFTYSPAGGGRVTPSSATMTNGVWTGEVTPLDPTELCYLVVAGSGPTLVAKSGIFRVIVPNLPTAQDDAATLDEDSSVPVALSAGDADGDALTYTITDAPRHGALSGDAPNLTYTPAANWHGTDRFTFTARDIDGVSNPATVTLTVLPVEDPPVAADLVLHTYQNKALTFILPGSDGDGDALTWRIEAKPAHGALYLLNARGECVYTPAAGYVGPDAFRFSVSDGKATVAAAAAITVSPWTLLQVQYTGTLQYQKNQAWLPLPAAGAPVAAGTQWIKADGRLKDIAIPEGASTVVKSVARLVVRATTGAPVAGVACDLLTPAGWLGLGDTDAAGTVMAVLDGLVTNATFRLRDAGSTREKTQNLAANSVVVFTIP